MGHKILYVMRHIDAGGYVDIPYKKIGITGKGNATLSSRLRQISNTKSPIKAQCAAAWEFPEAKELESALHKFLEDRRVEGEWFLDLDDVLVEQLEPLMSLLKAERIIIDNDSDNYTKDILSREPQNLSEWKNKLLTDIENDLKNKLEVNTPKHGLTFFNKNKSLTYYVGLRKSGKHSLCVGKTQHSEAVAEIFNNQGFDVLFDSKGYPFISNINSKTIAAMINLIEAKVAQST